MRSIRFVAVLSLSASLADGHAWAQTTRIGQIDAEKAAKAANVQPEAREKGDRLITMLEHVFMPPPPAVRLTLGHFRPGAGLAAGLEYTRPVGDGGLWNAAAAWSVRDFKQAETSIAFPVLSPARVRVRPYATWDDAPSLPFYGSGPGSSRAARVTYGLRTTEVGAGLRVRASRWTTIGGGASFLSIWASAGAGVSPSSVDASVSQGASNARASPSWWHATAFTAFDWRTSPGYTDAGGLYRVAFHDYASRGQGFDFTRTEIDLRQFIPLLQDNWIIGLQARADMTRPSGGQVIPFFMLPSLGGRDTLPGFMDYRFADRNSLLLRSELRWTASPVLDMAVFLDQGTVAHSVGALDLHDLKRGWGLGARFHGRNFTALRLDVAHAVEGWRFTIEPGVSF